MSKDPFEEVKEMARTVYHPPPETPREAIWTGIQAARGRSATEGRDHKKPRLRVIPGGGRLRPWIWVPAAAAAVLVLGILIGRLSVVSAPGPSQVPSAAESPAATPDESPLASAQPDLAGDADERPHGASPVYRLAAANFLGQTDAMLTSFKTGSLVNGELAMWAKDLLLDARNLLDSPASENMEIKILLTDLELVLAQIVQLTKERREPERQMIITGLAERDILFRVRANASAGAGRLPG